MDLRKTGEGQSHSSSLRTAQPDSRKLSDSDKLVGTRVDSPAGPDEGTSIAIQLPADGMEGSLSVQPASGQAKQVIGDLSRLGTKLRGSHESQTTKRKQSEAGIGEEDGVNGSAPKRQHTEDVILPRAPAPGNADDNPIVQPVPQVLTQPIEKIPVRPAEPVLVTAPEVQAQAAIAETLRTANSNTHIKPEQISELFQFLCRTNLWPMLKLEEQRVEQRALFLMNFHGFLPTPYGAPGVAAAGMRGAGNAPSSEPISQATKKTESITKPLKENYSLVNEFLLPELPKPPSLMHAQTLLSSLPEATQRSMNMPPEKIIGILRSEKTDLVTFNNMTAFVGCLIEIASHGGLPHLTGQVDSIVDRVLTVYLAAHRKFKGKKARTADTNNIHKAVDPVYAYLLRLLPKYPQFARMLGIGINKMTPAQRRHLALARKVNDVLTLMKESRFKSAEEFEQELNAIIGESSLSIAAVNAKTASGTESTPTSVPDDRDNDNSDEGTYDDI